MVSRRIAVPFNVTRYFLAAAKWWTCAMLLSAILISVPPLNSVIHGTHVVTAHAMGTEIGIDSMILLGGISWILSEILLRRGGTDASLQTARMRCWIVGFNWATVLLIAWLHIWGAVVGYTRYQHLPPPRWLRESSSLVFAGTGLAAALFLALLLAGWIRLAFRGATETHRRRRGGILAAGD